MSRKAQVSGLASALPLPLLMVRVAGSADATLAPCPCRRWDHPKQKPLEWVAHPGKDVGGLLYNGFVLTTKWVPVTVCNGNSV